VPESASSASSTAASGPAHGYDFEAINQGHNFPSPVIKWVHGHPILILHAPKYAQKQFASLAAEPGFASAQPDEATGRWAADHASAPGYAGPPAGDLAKAMTLAQDHAWLGAMPRALSFFNHQTFWSTVALILGALVLCWFARRKATDLKPANRIQHILEALVLFVRDDIVRPNFQAHAQHAGDAGGHHGHAQPADRWTPFFAALFLALLTCNLFGLIPLFGTATGNFAVTATWAAVIMVLMLSVALWNNGLGYFAKQVPIPFKADPITLVLWPFLFVIETLQLVIRPAALAIRLFANMLAGHIVLLVFASLGFIVYAGSQDGGVGLPSAVGIAGWFLTIGFYAFEVLVSFLQAYIFTLLSAVFISLCAHPEH
jgi:F-type H+-transporting ATPase subunit a